MARVRRVVVPWTQLLELRWRPALSFYEQRTEILRCLDDRKLLRAFRVQADHVDARLSTPGHQLRVRQSGLALELLGKDADPEIGWECVVAALSKIKPEQTAMSSRYQHIVPLDGPFEETVRAARDRFLMVPDSEHVEDWALIMNLPGAATVELGIIRQREAIPRLTRTVGGMSAGDLVQASQGFWSDVELPEVALFADSHWPGAHVDPELDAIREEWSAARDRAGGLVDQLYGKIKVEV